MDSQVDERPMQETLPAELMRPHRSPAGWVLLVGLLCLLFGVAGGWALRTILEPPDDVLASPGFTLVEARQGSVGQALRLNTSAQWTPESTLVGQASGMVTTVELVDGTEQGQGARLFTVSLRPVVVAVGEIPAFRDLSMGADGLDVAQLQQMLMDLGHDPGEVDGRFDATVRNAVREWQRDLGMIADGVVRVGDIVFVPHLPASLALPPGLEVGVMLSAGDAVLHVLPPSPDFAVVLPEGQARLVEEGVVVEIPRESGTWSGTVTEIRQDPQTGGSLAVLQGENGRPVCGTACRTVPFGDTALLPSVVHVVPEVQGVALPVAAIASTADGQTVVVLESGERVPVVVVASASGMVVVEGLDAGTKVRVPGDGSSG